jgi:hypothetical protein
MTACVLIRQATAGGRLVAIQVRRRAGVMHTRRARDHGWHEGVVQLWLGEVWPVRLAAPRQCGRLVVISGYRVGAVPRHGRVTSNRIQDRARADACRDGQLALGQMIFTTPRLDPMNAPATATRGKSAK